MRVRIRISTLRRMDSQHDTMIRASMPQTDKADPRYPEPLWHVVRRSREETDRNHALTATLAQLTKVTR